MVAKVDFIKSTKIGVLMGIIKGSWRRFGGSNPPNLNPTLTKDLSFRSQLALILNTNLLSNHPNSDRQNAVESIEITVLYLT